MPNIRRSLQIPELSARDRRRWLQKVFRSSDTDCWIWIGSRNSLGYGRFAVAGLRSDALAHRVGYILFRGPLAPGSVLMHLCDNRTCVNPDHLQMGTCLENTWDMIGKGRQRGIVEVVSACPF